MTIKAALFLSLCALTSGGEYFCADIGGGSRRSPTKCSDGTFGCNERGSFPTCFDGTEKDTWGNTCNGQTKPSLSCQRPATLVEIIFAHMSVGIWSIHWLLLCCMCRRGYSKYNGSNCPFYMSEKTSEKCSRCGTDVSKSAYVRERRWTKKSLFQKGNTTYIVKTSESVVVNLCIGCDYCTQPKIWCFGIIATTLSICASVSVYEALFSGPRLWLIIVSGVGSLFQLVNFCIYRKCFKWICIFGCGKSRVKYTKTGIEQTNSETGNPAQKKSTEMHVEMLPQVEL